MVQRLWLTIQHECFDYHWRRLRVGGQYGRVNHGNAVLGGKPELAVTHFRACRPASPITLGIEHSVTLSVGNRSNRAPMAFGEILQFPFIDAMNPSVGTHPKITARVFKNLEYAVIKHPLPGSVTSEPAIFETA